MKGETEVRRRVQWLDHAPPDPTTSVDPLADLARVAYLLAVTANVHAPDVPTAEPALLDDIVQDCGFLKKIASSIPALSPTNLVEQQLWTGASITNQPSLQTIGAPSAANFRSYIEHRNPQVKPSRTGLYTSTQLPGPMPNSMWLMYLEGFSGTMFPKPWHTYELSVSRDARVYDVGTAQSWASLVQQHPLHSRGLVYPDWQSISEQYDAVHFTLPAIVAMQEVRLTVESSVIAEGYWDAEQTFWLNWRFDSARLVRED
jgi:hypothetical protein